MFDFGETNRGWSFSTGYAKSFRRNGATLLPIRFRPKHPRRNVLARNILQMDRSRLFMRWRQNISVREGDRQTDGEREREGWKREEKRELLTIFSSINSLSITIERVCPSVNATIMQRWSVSVQLRSPGCVLRPPPSVFPPSFVSLFIDSCTRAIITDR